MLAEQALPRWAAKSHGSYHLAKICFFSLYSSHAREPRGRSSATDTRELHSIGTREEVAEGNSVNAKPWDVIMALKLEPGHRSTSPSSSKSLS